MPSECQHATGTRVWAWGWVRAGRPNDRRVAAGLRVAAASSATFHAEHGAEARLTQRYHRVFADVAEACDGSV